MKVEKRKVPSKASILTGAEFGKDITVAEFEEGGKKVQSINMVGYTGAPVVHWYWGRLVLDMDGVQSKPKIPLLKNHRTDSPIGFSDKPVRTKRGLEIQNGKLLTNEFGNEVADLLSQGFPMEASVLAQALKIEELKEGTSASVNGYTLKGPAAIFRVWDLKETSVCVFGADPNTESTLTAGKEEQGEFEVEFSVDDSQQHETEVQKVELTLEILQKDHAELMAAILKAPTEEIGKLKTQLAAKESEITGLKADSAKLSDMQTKILAMEKKVALQEEKERVTLSAAIWKSALEGSKIPAYLHDKVMPHVTHVTFVKDGILDEVKFREAIKAEITDWENRGATVAVQGFGTSERTPSGNSASLEKEMDDDADALFALSGAKKGDK